MIYCVAKAFKEKALKTLKKRKHFTPKKKDSFQMSLFLSSRFSFQTRTDLVLVKIFFNAAVQRFLNVFRKFAGKRLWWKPFLGKFKLFKMDSGKGNALSIFTNIFLWLLPNIEQKRIPLNDNIVWCKYSRAIKDFSKSGSYFLLNIPKYLGARLFYSLYAQTLRVLWNVFFYKKKSWKSLV